MAKFVPPNAPAAAAPTLGPPVASLSASAPASPSASRGPASPGTGGSSAYTLPANALLVGPGHPYARPCQAIGAAKPGATIGIDAKGNGSYDGDVCGWSTSGLIIAGFNGRARIDAAGRNAQGKATWVIAGTNTTIRNVELSGATVPDNNGAAIRQEGANLTVIGCYFHDNQDGILAGDNASSDIVVRTTEFARNGAGDGYSHNFYINHVHSFTLEGSWSHDALVGHLVKSRAAVNYLRYNRLSGQAGSDSYELDLPNGGLAYVIGNVIQQGSGSQNPAMLAYGEEGNLNPNSQLFAVNNTFVNDLGRGTAIVVGAGVTMPAVVVNNVSVGSTALVSQSGATVRTNCVTTAPVFVNRSGYDYRLAAGSPCLNAAADPGSGQGNPLAPTLQYAHPANTVARPAIGQPDAGAYESG